MTTENELEPRHEAAIAALLTSPSIRAAAEAVGHDESTLRRWLKEPAFASAYAAARRAVLSQASTRLVNACTDAVTCLQDVMADDEAPHAAKVSAARAILECGVRFIETEELGARLLELEKTIADRGNV